MSTAVAALSNSFDSRLQPLVEHRSVSGLPQSSRPENDVKAVSMSRDSVDRKIRADEAPTILRMKQAEFVKAVADALRRAFGQTDAAVKRTVLAAGCDERAAKNWLSGRNAPNALYLLKLMATVPELQGEIRRLTAMEANLDPEFERAFLRAVQSFEEFRRGGR